MSSLPSSSHQFAPSPPASPESVQHSFGSPDSLDSAFGFSPLSGIPQAGSFHHPVPSPSPSPEPGPGRVRFAAGHQEHVYPGPATSPIEDLDRLVGKNRKAMRKEAASMDDRMKSIVRDRDLDRGQKKAEFKRLLDEVSADPETLHLAKHAREELGRIRLQHPHLVDHTWLGPQQGPA